METSGGVFGWLDTLTEQVGNVAGKAVDVVGTVARAQPDQVARTQTDPRLVLPVSGAQAAAPNLSAVLPWVALGVAVLVVGVLILRSR